MWNAIVNFLNSPLVAVCASLLSIISAIFSFFQYKNTKTITKELEHKLQNYDKAQIRGKLKPLIEKIIENQSNPKKLLIGGKLNKEVTQVLSEMRSSSIYTDSSISSYIQQCERGLTNLSQGGGNISDLKDALCDLSRAIDNSVKE